MAAVETLRKHLGDGDLTCTLCDRGAATPLMAPWPHRFGPETFAGEVRTVRLRAGEVAGVDRALDDLPAGSVLAILNETDTAVWGGRLAARALDRGAAGVVVAGAVRDVPTLRRGGLPVIARDVTPQRSDAADVGEIDRPLRFGTTRVAPDDVLVADANGVVRIASDELARVRVDLAAWVAADG